MNWIIEPYDPLIVRDGRPFSADPGARAKSLPFPPPSVTAGGARTQAGLAAGGNFDQALVANLKAMTVRGPLLAELNGDAVDTYLAPAPADALFLAQEDAPKMLDLRRLQPLPLLADASVDEGLSLIPVGLPAYDARKATRAAAYWHWKRFERWLTHPTDEDGLSAADLGHDGPGRESRTHVAIDPETQTGKEGMLFATSGLEFWKPIGDQDPSLRLSLARRLALVIEVESPPGETLQPAEGYIPLGGERRLMRWRKGGKKLPELPAGMADTIAATGRCRVILLTPACFEAGWKPRFLLKARAGITVDLEAAIVDKPLVVSGWSLENGKRGPKPTRRLAPAGSVYYLKLAGEPEAIRQWIDATWLHCVSDTDEDRMSGFGLAVVGVHPADAPQGPLTQDTASVPPQPAKTGGE